jgi:chaperonin GroEL (HSP60 family)
VAVIRVDAPSEAEMKVVRMALENAVSVASVLLLTEATLTEEPDKPALHPGAADPEL